MPALAAIALGLIYGFGAITIFGQIAGANVNAVQLMGLIPIEQILSRGIGSIISQFDQILIALALSAPFFWVGTHDAPEELPRSRFLLAVVGLLLVLLALTAPIKEAVVISIAMFVSVGTGVAMRRVFRDRNRMARVGVPLSLLFGGLATVLALSIGTAVIQPAPLPAVRLELRDNTYTSGGWITTTDGSWYLARGNGTIASISTREVVESDISYPGREPEQSVLEWIFGIPPPSG